MSLLIEALNSSPLWQIESAKGILFTRGGLMDAVAEKAERFAISEGPVGLNLPNGPDWILFDLALLAAGRPSIPLPTFFTSAMAIEALDDAGATMMVSSNGVELRWAAERQLPAGTAKISYTSGSTGAPKGVCLSEVQMLRTAQAVVSHFGTGRAGRHLSILPLGVLLENVAGLYACLLAGGVYVLVDQADIGMSNPFRPDYQRMVVAILQLRITSIIVVPEILAGLVAMLEETRIRLPMLEIVAVGGARVSLDLLDRADAVRLPVVQGYGLTEAGSVIAIETLGERERGTVGTPLGHVGVRLATDGEILIEGSGYLGTVAAPQEPNTLATGDLGRIDDGGRLTILGRKSSLIITGFGRNISPEWVEEQLLAETEIAQAMVYGDDDAALSAYLVPSSREANVTRAVEEANARLPEYARIRRWRPCHPFRPTDGTLTANGRLRRKAITARETSLPFFDQLAADTSAARAHLLAVEQLRAGLAGQISRETYLAYLAQAYHHVRHTVPLMQAARARLLAKPTLVEALDAYIVEETGHEHWILEDIAAAGGDPAAVVRAGPNPATKAMVDYAYHQVRNGNPASFFGMVFVLEGTSIALAQQGAEAVRDSLGLPPEAFRYLTSHGALDQDHMRFFAELMNKIDCLEDRRSITEMANAIFSLFADLFASIPLEIQLETA